MTKEIDFYFDFISPYTYLAYKKIESLSKNIKINYKPIKCKTNWTNEISYY